MPIAKLVAPAALSFAVLSLVSPAAAQEPSASTSETVLGRPGTIVLDRLVGVEAGGVLLQSSGVGALGATYSVGPIAFGHVDARSGTSTSYATSVSARPSLDVFVTRRLTLGGELVLGYAASGSDDETSSFSTETWSVGAAPRVGVYVPISEVVALWPRLSVGATYLTGSSSGPPPTSSAALLRATLDLDLAITLGRHLALLAGPRVTASHTWSDGGGPFTQNRATSVAGAVHGSLAYAF